MYPEGSVAQEGEIVQIEILPIRLRHYGLENRISGILGVNIDSDFY